MKGKDVCKRDRTERVAWLAFETRTEGRGRMEEREEREPTHTAKAQQSSCGSSDKDDSVRASVSLFLSCISSLANGILP